MRWKAPKESDRPLYNIKKWFALVPITISDETRWMEYVEVEYETVIISKGVAAGKVAKRFVN